MKILQLGKFYPPAVGGIERVLYELTEGLNRAGMKCDVLCSNNKNIYEYNEINGYSVYRTKSYGKYFSTSITPQIIYKLNEIQKNYDIIDIHLPDPMANLAVFLTRPEAKIILHWHSDIVKQKKLLRLYKPFMTRFLGKADKIIVATPQHIESSIFLKNFKNKCKVIPFGVDVNRFELNSTKRQKVEIIRNRYGSKIILFVGRLIYYKGIEYLIRAMKDVDAKLLVVGEGVLEDSLRKLIIELDIEDKVVFIGKVEEEEVPIYFHACDIFVLPSIANSEAFGFVQLEAMACRKPVINTDLPTGVPYVSLNGETGITVPPEDSVALAKAMSRLLSDADLKEKYGDSAIKRVKKCFTIDKMVERVYQVYKEVLE